MQTRLNSYDEEEPGERVEPILPLHAVWNKHKVVQLRDAEPAVKATQILSLRHAHTGKGMYSLLLTRIYILLTWCFIFGHFHFRFA